MEIGEGGDEDRGYFEVGAKRVEGCWGEAKTVGVFGPGSVTFDEVSVDETLFVIREMRNLGCLGVSTKLRI